ncbi:hypothetical protein BDZ91DRAFT_765008 [Kalaharituber pfeilii]|nr:hypothetical protein BDZ91DRAFT_765008 [Kalaharituber pfeilii]
MALLARQIHPLVVWLHFPSRPADFSCPEAEPPLFLPQTQPAFLDPFQIAIAANTTDVRIALTCDRNIARRSALDQSRPLHIRSSDEDNAPPPLSPEGQSDYRFLRFRKKDASSVAVLGTSIGHCVSGSHAIAIASPLASSTEATIPNFDNIDNQSTLVATVPSSLSATPKASSQVHMMLDASPTGMDVPALPHHHVGIRRGYARGTTRKVLRRIRTSLSLASLPTYKASGGLDISEVMGSRQAGAGSPNKLHNDVLATPARSVAGNIAHSNVDNSFQAESPLRTPVNKNRAVAAFEVALLKVENTVRRRRTVNGPLVIGTNAEAGPLGDSPDIKGRDLESAPSQELYTFQNTCPQSRMAGIFNRKGQTTCPSGTPNDSSSSRAVSEPWPPRREPQFNQYTSQEDFEKSITGEGTKADTTARPNSHGGPVRVRKHSSVTAEDIRSLAMSRYAASRRGSNLQTLSHPPQITVSPARNNLGPDTSMTSSGTNVDTSMLSLTNKQSTNKSSISHNGENPASTAPQVSKKTQKKKHNKEVVLPFVSLADSISQMARDIDKKGRVMYFATNPSSTYPLNVQSSVGIPSFVNLLTPVPDGSGPPRFVAPATLKKEWTFWLPEFPGGPQVERNDVQGTLYDISQSQLMGLVEWEKAELEQAYKQIKGVGLVPPYGKNIICRSQGKTEEGAKSENDTKKPTQSSQWTSKGQTFKLHLRHIQVAVFGPGTRYGAATFLADVIGFQSLV